MKRMLFIFPLIYGLFVAGMQTATQIGFMSAQTAIMGTAVLGIPALWFTCDTYFAWIDLSYIKKA